MLETSKHSIRIGSDSRLSASRSSSSASIRRSRRCSVCCGVRREREPRVLRRQLLQPPLLPALRGPHLHACAAPLGEELLERRQVARVARDDDLRRDARRRAVVLEAELLEHRRQVLPADVLEVEAVAVDHLPFAEREDLHGAAVTFDRDPEHVDGSDRALVRGLPLGEVADREQPVPKPRRLLETLLRCGLAHALLDPRLDRLGVALEEADHAVDDLAVGLLRDVVHAGRVAAVDVEVEARDPGVTPRLRPLARPELEGAVQDVQRAAYLFRIRVRAEVDDAATVPLAREHHARVLVLDRDRDVRERLVVPQPHVERRPMALDEVLLEVERLDLVAGHDHLDVGDAGGELLDRRPGVRVRLEVATGPAGEATSPCPRRGPGLRRP